MARPEFVMPDFLSDTDASQIQERMMGNLPADISDMEGDFPYDFTMPTAIELSQVLQFHLVRAMMIAFPEYAWDDWLNLHGSQAHVTRHEATPATGTISVTAEYGTVLAAGTIFAVPATEANEAIEFQTLQSVTFSEDGTLDIPVEAVVAGNGGNVAANTITIMSSPIEGVIEITNVSETSGGTEMEDDDDYYERIHAEFEDAQFYVGNDADFVKWSKEVDGIGDCIVASDDDDPGVVRLILVDSNGKPANSTLAQAVYNHIVSPNDRSQRLLPTGSCQLIVEAAKTKAINYTCTGLVLKETTIDAVVAAFKKQVETVYADAKADNVLRYNSVRPVLSNIDGVEDFSDFLMNDGRANIALESAEYADTGTISFSTGED